MKKWVCSVCGYVYEGENPPEKCPVCGSYMVEKGNKLVCANETCGHVMPKKKDE